MKRLSVVFALLLLAVTPLLAEGPAAGDQQKLVQHLQRTSEKFLKSVEGLSEAQWNFKPAPERWSIAECAEHITAAETLIRGAVEKGLTEPLEGGATAELVKDELISTMIIDRSKKFSAPEPLVPTKRFGSPEATLETFRKERAATIKLAEGDANFRAHAVKHPGFGMLDTYGWMLFLSAHSERHTLQIEEVKAHADFPKN
jgi:hypothetical protein